MLVGASRACAIGCETAAVHESLVGHETDMPMRSPHVRFWGQNRHVIQDEPLSVFLPCPFEPKAPDWGWFEGRMVALDHSTSAWEADEPTSA